MLEHLIGKRSNKVLNVVERGAVKKFAQAIGDAHPIYIDEEYGTQTRYKNNIAPPTFPMVFDYGEIEGLNIHQAGLIHGEQQFNYQRPLLIGEALTCFQEVENYYERSGSSGTMGFLAIKSSGEDHEGKTVFTSKIVIIITEAVRKEMGK